LCFQSSGKWAAPLHPVQSISINFLIASRYFYFKFPKLILMQLNQIIRFCNLRRNCRRITTARGFLNLLPPTGGTFNLEHVVPQSAARWQGRPPSETRKRPIQRRSFGEVDHLPDWSDRRTRINQWNRSNVIKFRSLGGWGVACIKWPIWGRVSNPNARGGGMADGRVRITGGTELIRHNYPVVSVEGRQCGWQSQLISQSESSKPASVYFEFLPHLPLSTVWIWKLMFERGFWLAGKWMKREGPLVRMISAVTARWIRWTIMSQYYYAKNGEICCVTARKYLAKYWL